MNADSMDVMPMRECEFRTGLMEELDRAQEEFNRHDLGGHLDPRAIGNEGLMARAERRVEELARLIANCALLCQSCGIQSMSRNNLIATPVSRAECPMKNQQ